MGFNLPVDQHIDQRVGHSVDEVSMVPPPPPEQSVRNSRLSGRGGAAAGGKPERLQPAGRPAAGGSDRPAGDL